MNVSAGGGSRPRPRDMKPRHAVWLCGVAATKSSAAVDLIYTEWMWLSLSACVRERERETTPPLPQRLTARRNRTTSFLHLHPRQHYQLISINAWKTLLCCVYKRLRRASFCKSYKIPIYFFLLKIVLKTLTHMIYIILSNTKITAFWFEMYIQIIVMYF